MRKSFRAKLTGYLYNRLVQLAFRSEIRESWKVHSAKYKSVHGQEPRSYDKGTREYALQCLISETRRQTGINVSRKSVPEWKIILKQQQLNLINNVRKNKHKTR